MRGEHGRSRDHEGRGRLRGLLHRRHRRQGALFAPADGSVPAPFERAAARFNSSDAGHAVAGLTRTLGVPRASVGASAGAPDEVRVTIAWELSWYQWGVDVADELRPVVQLGKGSEIDQLDAAARQWNAVVSEGGQLRLAGEPAPSR